MIIGHLPAGYIFSKSLVRIFSNDTDPKRLLRAGLLGSIAPDFDMFYFHLIDNKQHPHHTYLPHMPVFWFGLLVIFAVWYKLSSCKRMMTAGLLFPFTGILHLVLDSVVGQIWWLYPFIDKPYSLFSVVALYKPWWLNFLFHWTFGFEIVLCIWALLLWCRSGEL